MSVKTQRQDARRRAREARSEQERARKAREQRLEDLAVTVLTSMDAVVEHERRAGEALRTMVEEEGLSLREAVSWCGDEVSVRTAARFKRLVTGESGGEPAAGDEDAGAADAESHGDDDAGDGAGDGADAARAGGGRSSTAAVAAVG